LKRKNTTYKKSEEQLKQKQETNMVSVHYIIEEALVNKRNFKQVMSTLWQNHCF